MHGPHTILPRSGASETQGVVAFSSPEAAVLAAELQALMFHEDNQACTLVIRLGRSQTMRHLGRARRVSIQALHERLGAHPNKDSTILNYEDTLNMFADIRTNLFSNDKDWCRAQGLINVRQCKSINSKSLSAWVRERNEIGRALEVLRARGTTISKVGKRRTIKEQVAAAISYQTHMALVWC